MKVALFYADVLGFSTAAVRPRARRALEQLSDVAHMLSTEDSLAKYLQRPIWKARYALSDSIFLVGHDPIDVCGAAAEFFFNLAFYNARRKAPVLMRGAVTFGEVRRTRAIFPETASANLVGEAVVRAVQLEKSGPKGPRLLISTEVARALKRSKLKPLLDTTEEGLAELLWLLSPDISLTEGALVGDVVAAAARLALSRRHRPAVTVHHVAYLALCLRSLLRLERRFPQAAATALKKANLKKIRARLDDVLDSVGASATRSELARLLS